MNTAETVKDKRTAAGERDESAEGAEAQPKRAVLYLRVSTTSQVKTDYNPEGISLPAQREACESKAATLNAEVVREFVEPGRSATEVDHRPSFQEMMSWVKEQAKSGNKIDYVVVYMFSRIFRNSVDAHITKRDLKKAGVRIVSVNIDLGEGPEAAMVESIMHAVDQYQSEASGADISYKMAAKARNGGTLGLAPLGYRNARDLSEGRNIGVVEFDPERKDLVRVAFELYASGDYSLDSLQAELTGRGLRSRPGRYPSTPVSTSKLAAMLRDPYYIGFITYKGEVIPGRHERLIDDELFNRVQEVLAERRGRGERQRRHHHHLKGLLWCWDCHERGVESRMIMQWATGNGGRYRYYFCRQRPLRQCDLRYIESDAIEAAIVDHYATLRLPADLAENLRQDMCRALEEEAEATKLARQQLQAELARLEKQEENLLDLAGDGEITTAKVKVRLGKITIQKQQLRQQLDQTDTRLMGAVALIDDAVRLLEDPQGLYRSMAPEQRRLMNQALFERLYVIEDRVAVAVLRAPFGDLVEATREVSCGGHVPVGSRKGGRPAAWASPLAGALSGRGSKSLSLVGEGGFEPPTSCTQSTCATWLRYSPSAGAWRPAGGPA
jgi:site-specific DNA recombinase